jgi:hypothetical protein
VRQALSPAAARVHIRLPRPARERRPRGSALQPAGACGGCTPQPSAGFNEGGGMLCRQSIPPRHPPRRRRQLVAARGLRTNADRGWR